MGRAGGRKRYEVRLGGDYMGLVGGWMGGLIESMVEDQMDGEGGLSLIGIRWERYQTIGDGDCEIRRNGLVDGS